MSQVLTSDEILDLVRQRFPGEEARILLLIGQQAAVLRAQLASDGGSIIGVEAPPGYTQTELNALLAELASAIGGGGGAWGGITGTLSDQTDLQAALDAKLDDSQATAFGLSLLNDADAAAARSTLELGTAATQSSTAFDAAGTGAAQATAAVAAHTALADPHPQYLTPAEGNAAYEAIGAAAAAIAAHTSAGDPHSQYLTQAEADALYAPSTTSGAPGFLLLDRGIH
jgi:hypothetical protein